MKQTPHIEPLSGGLVTARPPWMLSPGELSLTTNCGYRFDSLRLRPADPRLQILSGINGGAGYNYNTLGFIQFDDSTAFLLTQTPDTGHLRAIEASNAASELAIASYTQSSTLTVLHFRNKALVLNGAHVNRVLSHTGGSAAVAPTAVQHGCDPVTHKLGIVMTTGTWPLGETGLDQWYEYWYTEVIELTDGEIIESDTSADAVVTTPAIIDALTDAVRLTIPAQRNNTNATAIRIYRSVGKATQSDKSFPIGVRLIELPLDTTGATADFTDGNQSSTSTLTGTGSSVGSPAWSNPTNVASNNNVYATCAITHDLTPTHDTGELRIGTFGITGVTNPIAGIEVDVDAKYATTVSASRYQISLRLDVSLDNGSTWTEYAGIPITTGDPAAPYTVGDRNNNLLGMEAGALSGTGVLLRLVGSTNTTASSGTTTFSVDYAAIRIYFAGNTSSSSEPFPAVILNINGETASVGANGKPPTASTGCILQDALLCNDIANPSFVWWSLSANIHAVPGIYFNDCETDRNDAVKCIRALGARAVIGLETALWRVDYLPTEDDANFVRGQGPAFSEFDPSFGIVGPGAACTFVGPDGRNMLAFVSLDGPRISDLFSTSSACDDVDWRGILPASEVSRCLLVNYPRNYTLRLYYPAGNATYLTKFIDLLYHPVHLKNGKMKAVGPVTCGASDAGVRGAVSVPTLHTDYSWSVVEAWGGTAGSGGSKFWRRVDLGTGSATAQQAVFATRQMFLAGFGSELMWADAYILGLANANVTLRPTISLQLPNSTAASPTDLQDIVMTANPKQFTLQKSGSSATITFTSQTDMNIANNGWDLIEFWLEGMGKEDH